MLVSGAKITSETHICDLRHEFLFGSKKTGNCCVQAILQLVKRVQTPDTKFKLRRIFFFRVCESALLKVSWLTL
jgi:hypothetical protein